MCAFSLFCALCVSWRITFKGRLCFFRFAFHLSITLIDFCFLCRFDCWQDPDTGILLQGFAGFGLLTLYPFQIVSTRLTIERFTE